MNRTIRLFVSSTFSDFKAERDLLQREVFPKLQQLCLSKGLRFQAIDLRWGVPEEAGKDNRTMRLCLRELKRCQEGEIRPNFLVLLGDRYGWRPLPETIPAEVFEEFERILTRRRGDADLLGEWYRLDENAVPAEYVLKPRTGRFEDFNVWSGEVERPLLKALEAAAAQYSGGYEPAGEQQARSACCTAKTIGLSATHQEILHGALGLPEDEARKHVHAFRRQIAGSPATPQPAFTDCLRGGTHDVSSRERLDRLCDELNGHLGKDNLHYYTVPWRDEGAFGDGDLEMFAAEVFGALKQVIEAQIAALKDIPPEVREETAHRTFTEERRAGFVGRQEPLNRILEYLGTPSSTAGAAFTYAEATADKTNPLPHESSALIAPAVLAVVGPAGAGKSALMAEAVHRAERLSSLDSRHATPDTRQTPVIARFIGVTPGSSDLIELLRELVARIRARYPRDSRQGVTGVPPVASDASHEPSEKEPDDRDIPNEINPLTMAFHEALARATAERPLWLFLDALDQFRDASLAASLSWLPQKLPPHVRIVVAAAEPSTAGATNPLESSRLVAPAVLSDPRATIIRNLARFASGEQTLRLAPLTAADGRALLKNWLKAAWRTLDKSQRRPILDAFAVEGNALWLRVAAEEASRWPCWHKPVPPPPGLPDLLATVLEHLSRKEEHGEVFVRRALGYLACARHGVAEDEIIGVLGADPAVMADLIARSPTERVKAEANRIKALPVAIWVRFHGDIAFYLSERRVQGAALFGFYHRSFGEAVERFCLGTDADRLPLHETMARWFGAQPWFLPPTGENGQPPRAPERSDPANTRKASELPFHLQRVAELTPDADRWDPLVDVLCDLDCVETKARSGLIYELVGDYNAALAELPEFREEQVDLRRYDDAMRAYTKALREYAIQLNNTRLCRDQGEAMVQQDTVSVPLELKHQGLSSIPEDHSVRAARLRHFSNFALGQGRFLVQKPRGTYPTAYNWSDQGPVSTLAEQILVSYHSPYMLRSPRPSRRAYRPQCQLILEGHRGAVNCVSVSQDDRIAISASEDYTLRVWDINSGQCVRILSGHYGPVTSVHLAPDGRRALSSAGSSLHSDTTRTLFGFFPDMTLRLWDLDSGACLQVFKGHSGPVACVRFCTDARRAVSASWDKTLRLWDMSSGQCLRIFEGHKDFVTSVSVSPDGHHVVSASYDRTVRLWNLDSGKCLHIFENSTVKKKVSGLTYRTSTDSRSHPVLSVCVSSDGRHAISAGEDSILKLWSLEDQQSLRQFGECDYNNMHLSSVSFTPDGGRAVSSSDNNTFRLWNLADGKCLSVFTGHSHPVRGVTVCHNGRRAITASEDKMLRVWNLDSWSCLHVFYGHNDSVTDVTVCPNGRSAVSASADNTLRLWDLDSGKCLRSVQVHTCQVNGISVCPDGRHVVLASADHALHLWDLERGIRVRTLEGHNQSVTSVSISTDGGRTVSSSEDGTLRLWDLENGICLRILEGHSQSVTSVSISTDGNRAVSASEDGTLRLWDLENGICLRILEGHSQSVTSVSISTAGNRAASASEDGTLRLWDLENGMCLSIVEDNNRGFMISSPRVCVLPDGRHAVSVCGDNMLRLWNLENGELLRCFESHTDCISEVRLCTGGRLALTASNDTTLRLWDLDKGTCLRSDISHPIYATVAKAGSDKRLDGSSNSDVACLLWDGDANQSLHRVGDQSDYAECVNICSGRRHAVSQSSDNKLQLWDLDSGQCINVFPRAGDYVSGVSVCPDGCHVVTEHSDFIRIWSVAGGVCLHRLKCHSDKSVLLVLCQDGRRALAMAARWCSKETFQLWDIVSDKCLSTFEGHSADITSVSVCPDGWCAVSASKDNTLRLWKLDSGKCLRIFEGHSDSVTGVKVCPDGRRAISVSEDNTLRIWDLKTGKCSCVLEGHSQPVTDVCLSSNGHIAISSSEDCSLICWEIDSGRHFSYYHAGASVLCVAVSSFSDHIVCGTLDGQMHFLTTVNFPPSGPALITAQNASTARCAYCAIEFAPRTEVVAALQQHTATLMPDQSPCLALPDAAFDDPRLFANCPHCGRQLRFNPFFVDSGTIQEGS